MYMDKKANTKVSEFSIVDAKEWNNECKQRNKQKAASTSNKDCTDLDPKQHKQ